MLTKQILNNEITVEQAQFALVSYYRRVKPLLLTLKEEEDQAILRAMDRNEGHVDICAKELGISRYTLYRKLKRLHYGSESKYI